MSALCAAVFSGVFAAAAGPSPGGGLDPPCRNTGSALKPHAAAHPPGSPGPSETEDQQGKKKDPKTERSQEIRSDSEPLSRNERVFLHSFYTTSWKVTRPAFTRRLRDHPPPHACIMYGAPQGYILGPLCLMVAQGTTSYGFITCPSVAWKQIVPVTSNLCDL